MTTSSKLSPAQALPLLEETVRSGVEMMKNRKSLDGYSHIWLKHVPHLISEIEGVSSAFLRDLEAEVDFRGQYDLALARGEFPDLDECREAAVTTVLALAANQLAILRVKAKTAVDMPTPKGKNVFVGHGGNPSWMELREFLGRDLLIDVVEFNSVATAGKTITDRLKEMLDASGFAFLIMTAEDHVGKGKDAIRARQNVIHEIGLFQGRLGFDKAIILLEQGCQEFSNVAGLVYISFPKGNIRAAFHDIQRTLIAAGVVRQVAS